MNSLLAFLAGFLTLACAFGVLVMPDFRRASLCGVGVALGIGTLIGFTNGSAVAWILFLVGISIGLVSLKNPNLESTHSWHNWFLIVISTSALWFLSFFLLWTLEDALALPPETLSLAAEISDILGAIFDGYLWAVAMVALLGAVVLVAVTDKEPT